MEMEKEMLQGTHVCESLLAKIRFRGFLVPHECNELLSLPCTSFLVMVGYRDSFTNLYSSGIIRVGGLLYHSEFQIDSHFGESPKGIRRPGTQPVKWTRAFLGLALKL